VLITLPEQRMLPSGPEHAYSDIIDGLSGSQGYMKKMKKTNKTNKTEKKVLLFCLMIETVILAILVVRVVTAPHAAMTVPHADFTATTYMDEKDGGWYVDADYPLPDDGLFVFTPETAMDAGVYEITVNYETDSEQNYSTAVADTNTYHALLTDHAKLTQKLTALTYTVWLFDHTDNFSVNNYYTGSGYLIVKDITIVRTNKLERMAFAAAFFLFLLLDLVLWESFRFGSFAKFLYARRMLWLLLAAAFAAMGPNLGGVTQGDDIMFHLLRIEGLAKSFSNGIIPCKLQTNWAYGYGYAVSVFYGDMFLSIPAVIRLFGFTEQFAYNVFLFLIHFGTAASAYYCTKKISGSRFISYACAVVYLFNPYSLASIYYRNALGEAQAMVFLPLVVYGLFCILSENTENASYRRSWIPAVIGFTGIIESHMLSCVICAQFMVLLFLFNIRNVLRKKRFLMLVKTAVLTLLLNAWFLVPLLLSYHNLALTQPYKQYIRIQHTGLAWNELFAWDFGANTAGSTEVGFLDVKYTAGVVLALILLLFLILFVKDRAEGKRRIPRAAMYFWSFAVLALFLSTQYFPWDNIADLFGSHATMFTNMQFLNRYLTAAEVLSPFILCFALMNLKSLAAQTHAGITSAGIRTAAAALAVLAFVNVYPQIDSLPAKNMYDPAWMGRTDTQMAEYIYQKDVEYTSEDFMAHKIDPQYDYVPGKITAGDGVAYADFSQKGITAVIRCTNTSGAESYIELPLLYYEQYHAHDRDENELAVTPGTINLVRVAVPAGFDGTITVSYDYPVSWILSEVLSLLTLFGLVILAVWKRYTGRMETLGRR
jgi:hypothetical protein